MKKAATKRITVITGTTPESFQRLVNKALEKIDAPSLVFDNNRPFTVYIISDTRKGARQC